jgi:hypothetical protein
MNIVKKRSRKFGLDVPLLVGSRVLIRNRGKCGQDDRLKQGLQYLWARPDLFLKYPQTTDDLIHSPISGLASPAFGYLLQLEADTGIFCLPFLMQKQY